MKPILILLFVSFLKLPTLGQDCLGKYLTCSQIVSNLQLWGRTVRGIDLTSIGYNEDIGEFTLVWVGCPSDGCTPDEFYCKDSSYGIEFGSNGGVLRSLIGYYTSAIQFPQAYQRCAEHGDEWSVHNAPMTDVSAKQLCRELGYKDGVVTEKVDNNYCPEPEYNKITKNWETDLVWSQGWGKSYRCKGKCDDMCLGDSLSCKELVSDVKLWGRTVRGIDLTLVGYNSDIGQFTLAWIGCPADGCLPSEFFCKDEPNGISFGSTGGVLRSLMGKYITSAAFPQQYQKCAEHGDEWSVHNAPMTYASANQLCRELGYQGGIVVESVANNYCPEPEYNVLTKNWETDLVWSQGWGKSYRCNGECSVCLGNALTCIQIVSDLKLWGRTVRGIDLTSVGYNQDIGQFTLVWVGCPSDGCPPNEFYCKDTPDGLEFGSNGGVLRSLMGQYTSKIQFPQQYQKCAQHGDEWSVHNAPMTDVSAKQLCKELGYKKGVVVEKVDNNYCPEPEYNKLTKNWETDLVWSQGWGKRYKCSSKCISTPPTTRKPTKRTTERPTKRPILVEPMCLGKALRCNQIVSNVRLWGRTVRGIDLTSIGYNEDIGQFTLTWIGCPSDGCTPSQFFCNDESDGISFGSNGSILRSLMGNYNSPASFPQSYQRCAQHGDEWSIHNAPMTHESANQLCRELGYKGGVTNEFVASNYCPEPEYNIITKNWETDLVWSEGWGKSYTCKGKCNAE